MDDTYGSQKSQPFDNLLEYDRSSLMEDGFGDFCFAPDPFFCMWCYTVPLSHQLERKDRNVSNKHDRMDEEKPE
jgi:hypothetical protein